MGEPVDDWMVAFDFTDEIEHIWNAQIGILNMQYESGCFNLKDKYVELFGVDKESLKYRAADDEGEEYIYESDDKKARKYFALRENGFISYICDALYDDTEDKSKVEFNYEGKDKITFAALQTKYKINSVKAVDKVITPEGSFNFINVILNEKYQEAKTKVIVSAVKINDLSHIHMKDD